MAFTRICVYAGSSLGRDPAYREAAQRLAALLVDRGLGLVYGGASVGLMGVLADGVLAGGGEVIGVIPQQLVDREIGHSGLSELRVVTTMHERKALMAQLADAFIALPGGLGTLEELLETATWSQLGLHAKACGLLDVGGYWRPLAALLDHAVAEGFVKGEQRRLILVESDPQLLLAALERWIAPRDKWAAADS